jgi:hypothetical protein
MLISGLNDKVRQLESEIDLMDRTHQMELNSIKRSQIRSRGLAPLNKSTEHGRGGGRDTVFDDVEEIQNELRNA